MARERQRPPDPPAGRKPPEAGGDGPPTSLDAPGASFEDLPDFPLQQLDLRPAEEEVLPDPALARHEWEYEDARDDMRPNLELSVTLGAAASLPGIAAASHPNRLTGCEAHCIWTNTVDQVLPHCYGIWRGAFVLDKDDLLWPVVQETCARCLHQAFCRIETEKRFGPPAQDPDLAG